MKKKVLIIAVVVVAILGALCSIYLPNSEMNNALSEVENSLLQEIEVTVSEETQLLANSTIEATEQGEDIATTEEVTSSEETEQALEEEQLEVDAAVEQENISYEGTVTGDGLALLGSYQGLTYYSQIDSRWSNTVFTSTGNSSQTIGNSGCGPTSAAIVVSSSKGAILPTTMAQLAVDNGYRTVNNGTAWSYFSFVADYFDFEEFYSTDNYETALEYLNTDENNDGNADYYVVVSCGSGLFTYGGHYIVLVADNNSTITVYDSYLYSGKFSTASRSSANVVVSGNSVYVTETAFEQYANAKYYWIFSNDKGEGNTSTTITTSTTRYVATQSSSLNVRSGAGLNYSVTGSLTKGTAVTVTQTNGNWSYITSPKTGWVNNSYLSSTSVTSTSTTTTTSYTTGKYKVTASLLNVRSGAGTSYSTKTYKQLSSNARSQNKSLGNYYANGYLKGVVCTVTQVSGSWGKTASGWICLDYCTKIN